MRIFPIAQTQMLWANVEHGLPEFTTDPCSDGEALIQLAGRLCYLSWNRPNPATSTPEGYLANIRQQGHFSVYEHVAVSFYMDGVSRSCTHEVIRHRHLSFSELSQRFVDMGSAKVVTPPAMADIDDSVLDHAMNRARMSYDRILSLLTGRGATRKQIREAARSVMPNMTETAMVFTGNLRAWRHFISVRGSIHADAEIRKVAVAVAEHLREMYPAAMADIILRNEGGSQCVQVGQP